MRNLVICADGTGNTFDGNVSNVTRLVERIEVGPQQKVAYGQGIGTNADRLAAVERHRSTLENPGDLVILPGAWERVLPPVDLARRLLGLAAGLGLKQNVAEMWSAMGRLDAGPEDRIFLFGFSRGAFAVRALAGLLYRCDLPVEAERSFAAAWACYRPIRERADELERYRAAYPSRRRIEIEFLGVWDTVKSYGGLIPIRLPHLRHNPIVRRVCHAAALDETRSWFNVTTWGQLDLDEKGAMRRLKQEDLPRYAGQRKHIEEVWFRGTHSDVGGSEEGTARIALRWMLREAQAAGLRLNDRGAQLLSEPEETPVVHPPSRGWWVTEWMPRLEIDNSGLYPRYRVAWGRTGVRKPEELRRGGKVRF